MTAAELKALIEQRGVHPVFGAIGEGWHLEQVPSELAAFLARMDALGVRSALEIGTGYKGGLSRFLANDMGWQVTTVDVVDYHHLFPHVTYIIGEQNIEDWLREYPEGKYDLVFIDGDHRYASVKYDHAAYQRYAARAIGFHDIAGLRDCEGAQRYWREIAYDGDTLRAGYHEAIDADNPAGIGWVEL